MQTIQMQEDSFNQLSESLIVPVTNKLLLRDARSVIHGLRRQGVCCGLSLCNNYEVEVWRERTEGDAPHIKNKKSGAPLHGVICVDQEELDQRDIFVIWDGNGNRHEKSSAITQKLLARISRW